MCQIPHTRPAVLQSSLAQDKLVDLFQDKMVKLSVIDQPYCLAHHRRRHSNRSNVDTRRHWPSKPATTIV